MSKLQNVKAIRQMLDGTHKSQTRRVVNLSDAFRFREFINRSEGEVWTDEDGHEWVQKAGFKVRKSKLEDLRSAMQVAAMPACCPKCNQPMVKRLDKKFWKLMGHCFDCQVLVEHKLRISGKYEEYERQKMLENAKAWLADAERDKESLIKFFTDPLSFGTSDGQTEHWFHTKTPDEIRSLIEEEFLTFKESILKHFSIS